MSRTHLYHKVLELVVSMGYVRCRHNQKPPLLVEPVQEARSCIHICFKLHCYSTYAHTIKNSMVVGIITLHVWVQLKTTNQMAMLCHWFSILTDALSRGLSPAVVELADTAGDPPPLLAPVTVVLAHHPVVVPVRVTGEVTMERGLEDWTPPDWGETESRISIVQSNS